MMGGEQPALKPTLWRTCRVLASERRLLLLKTLADGRHRTVHELAEELGWPDTTATINLRACNARGLLQARRIGRFVEYRAKADPTIPETVALLPIVKKVLISRNDPINFLIHHFTAFTHSRRIRIVRTLGDAERTFDEIRGATKISRDAFRRHLEKLVSRGYLVADGNTIRCARPRNGIHRTLLKCARQQ